MTRTGRFVTDRGTSRRSSFIVRSASFTSLTIGLRMNISTGEKERKEPRAEGGGEKAEGGRQKAGRRKCLLLSAFCLLSSIRLTLIEPVSTLLIKLTMTNNNGSSTRECAGVERLAEAN